MKRLLTIIISLLLMLVLLPTGIISSEVKADNDNYLTFTAQEANSSVTFKYSSGSDVQYRKNDGAWTNCKAAQDATGDTITLESVGDKVQFKGNDVKTDNYYYFSMTGSINASGDVTSLTNGVGGDATLGYFCYSYMFYCCYSLKTAPNLPSTTLSNFCYYQMFQGCTGLQAAPELPAGKGGVGSLASNCYKGMFSGCTSLQAAPELPATTLANYCYNQMFSGCTSLTTAPSLPATTLTDYCYNKRVGCQWQAMSYLGISPLLAA